MIGICISLCGSSPYLKLTGHEWPKDQNALKSAPHDRYHTMRGNESIPNSASLGADNPLSRRIVKLSSQVAHKSPSLERDQVI
jgi:hypothetical protein